MKTHHHTQRVMSHLSVVAVWGVSIVIMLCGSIHTAHAQEQTPRKGGELVASLYTSPHHLNPAIQSGLATAFPGAQIFAGLVRFDNEWTPHPYLAEQWNISADGLSVALHLVEEAVFHDGHPITSEDVAFSVMTVKALHPFQSMLAPVERVDTPDPHTAIIRLSKPHPAIVLAMSPALLPILPKHVYGTIDNVKDHPANMQPVGSGPFVLEEFVPDQHILLTRNPDFFLKDRPYLDRITINIIRNTLEESMGMEVGNLHLMVSFQDINELNHLRSQDHVVVIQNGFKGIGPIYWLAFNLQKAPFHDVRVRKAIAYAIDREFIVNALFHGETPIETGPISSSNPFYSPDVNLYEQDFDKANRLLDEAGYPRDAAGKRFSFQLTYIPEKAGNNQRIIEYLRQVFLRNLGVEAIIEHPENVNAWAENVSNWEFDATFDDVFNWGDPVIGVHRTYLSSNIRKGVIWSNTQGYRNPVADALMERAAIELDFTKRYALYQEFQQLIVDELPLYPIFQPFFAIGHHKNLEGVVQSIWGIMAPLDTAYWKREPQ